MKLQFEQIKEITFGTARMEEIEEGVSFSRFTAQQQELYRQRDYDFGNEKEQTFYSKTFAASGICLRFRTDSQNLFMKAAISKGSSRSYFAFDLFVDGKRKNVLCNFIEADLPAMYAKPKAVIPAEYAKTFALGAGQKDVCLYFPWSVNVVLKEFCIDDGAFIQPLPQEKKMLCFGDSITQGYDALYPGNKYITRLAEHLGAQEYNKAIGGDLIFPELLDAKDDFEPDYIAVAYGTNDWCHGERETFIADSKAFYEKLGQYYPYAKIFAFTPIWRKDLDEEKPVGAFSDVEKLLVQAVAGCGNVTLIRGIDLVSHDSAYYADLRLHPNDKGFAQYFENLIKQL